MRQARTSNTGPIEALDTLNREAEKLKPLPARVIQAEDELEYFFALSPDLLCIAGLDGYFERLNPAWASCLGWSMGELMTRPMLDFVHPNDRKATLAEIDTLGESIPAILFENRYRHQNGSYRWLRWDARIMPGRQKICATAQDVTRQRQLEREILEIADREKERLGRELHDGLCQTLAGIAALSSTLSKKLAANSDSTASAAAGEIAGLLNEAIGQARDLAYGLNPISLAEVGLDGALEVLALNVYELFNVFCTLERHRPFLRLCHDTEAHLFRIAQEAVNNAVTHGRAKQIKISLSCKGGEGVLIVRDDGVGLPEEMLNPDGMGLQSMAYRARLIGAFLKIQRHARGGTLVFCRFPLTETFAIGKVSDRVRNDI